MKTRQPQHPTEPTLWTNFKRQSIQEAVIQLMCREGLKSVTMERVAQEVGIAKGTIYLHYRDKQQLLDEVKESALAPLHARLHEILGGDNSPAEKLEICANRHLAYFDERKELFRILLYEREVARVQGGRYQSERYRRLVREVSRVIAEGIEEGALRTIDPEKAATLFVEGCVAMVNYRLLHDQGDSVDQDARMIANVFLRGVSAAEDLSPTFVARQKVRRK
ncbi:MAG: TetR/AcrR family transcriptional regulator [Acidobacteriota bacterium]